MGGLVPSLLIDSRAKPSNDEQHPGTNDLDIGLALAVLDEERYAEISARLRAEGFEPDVNPSGNPTLQRWCLRGAAVTVDFLMPPAPEQDRGRRVQPLESDFGALVTPGLQLAFRETVQVELTGHTLKGEHVTRTIPVCGPAAFVVLKSLAFGDRAEPKDAYDLVYVIRHTEGRATTIGDRLAEHTVSDRAIVAHALQLLARDFASPEEIGPSRAAQFAVIDPGDQDEHDERAADAHGFVDDLLRRSRERTLFSTPGDGPSGDG